MQNELSSKVVFLLLPNEKTNKLKKKAIMKPQVLRADIEKKPNNSVKNINYLKLI
ncbi:hypothetical protein PESP_a0989 [Pseudoalteromonas espejiana DSM 9414]|uniref:Uncharacterized protein n=1 Tax=Pseudoalteromonas espejiana TaxID=28107 RepID=A0A510XW31_9GAMM|nr:hypothetical protein PESP_a0989 [Pseudoalteromonas espejiana DSM 9414]GEK54777.1 hypothetical protein PES01_16220 [Pseudoalteromonas espejiana]